MRRLVLAPLLALGCAPEPAWSRPAAAVPAGAPAEPPPTGPPRTHTPGPVEEDRPEITRIGVPQCDAYLALYRACEPKLQPEIDAGNRRSARSEAGWLQYLHEHDKDPGLASACEAMLAALRQPCDPG